MEPSRRPEMWTPEDVVQAVQDGHTFLLPFKFGPMSKPNGYYILGQQYFCFGVTVGPEHSPDLMLSPEGNLVLTLWFRDGMVPDEAFYAPLDEREVGPVHAFIDPDDVDWDLLNRSEQVKL